MNGNSYTAEEKASITFLPGEQIQSSNLRNVYFVLENREKGILGNIFLTSMRLSLHPDDKSIRSLPDYCNHNRFFNFFDIPLFSIHTLISGPTDNNNLQPKNDYLVIICKNFRIIKIFSWNSNGTKEDVHPSSTQEFSEFKKKLIDCCEKDSSYVIGDILERGDKWWKKNNLQTHYFNHAEFVDSIPGFTEQSDWENVLSQYKADLDWKVYVDTGYMGGLVAVCNASKKPAARFLLKSLANTLSNDKLQGVHGFVPALKRLMNAKKGEIQFVSRRNSLDNGTFHHTARTEFQRFWDYRCCPQVIPTFISLEEWRKICLAGIGSAPPVWHYSHPSKRTSLITLPELVEEIQAEAQTPKISIDQDAIKKIKQRFPIERSIDLFQTCPSSELRKKTYGKFLENLPGKRVVFLDLSQNPCTLERLQISYTRLINVCCGCQYDTKWFLSLHKTKWLIYVGRLLELTWKCVDQLEMHCTNVILRGSESDFSCSLACLVQIVSCPQMRTMYGFNSLITREWNRFGGHKWLSRLGRPNSTGKDIKSPVFLQFLDCVHQLIQQNPFSFEFSTAYLKELWDAATSGYHNTFMFNSLPDRMQAYLNRPKSNAFFMSVFDFPAYLRPTGIKSLYNQNYITDDSTGPIRCSGQQIELSFWWELYCRDKWKPCPLDKECDDLYLSRFVLEDEAIFLTTNEKRSSDSLAMTWLPESTSTKV